MGIEVDLVGDMWGVEVNLEGGIYVGGRGRY